MADLMFPDIAGTAMKGFQQGQQTRANRLIGEAMQNPDQRQQLLGQAGTIDPRTALVAGTVMDTQAALQQKMQQAQQLQLLKQLRGAALHQKAAQDSGNPAAAQAAHEAVVPLLTKFSAQLGLPPPSANFDPSSRAAIDQVLALTAFLDPSESKVTGYGPGTAIYRGVQQIGQVPFKPAPPVVNNGYQLTLGPDGKYTYSDIDQSGVSNAQPQTVAPNIGQPAPASTVEGAPPGTQVSEATGPDGQRVLFAFAPGTSDAVQSQTGAMAGLPQGTPQPSAQPQTLAQVIAQQAAAKKAQAATDSGQLSDDAQQMLAAAGAQGYKIPIPAFGMRNSQARIDYLNGIASHIKGSGEDWTTGIHNMLYGESGLTGSKAAQRLYGLTAANESAVEAQIPTILNLSAKVSRSGVPVLNKWILSGRQSLAGDPDVTNFNNSVQEFAEEYAKVMSGSPTGAATDSARALAHTLITSAMTPQQFQQVMQTMQTMMKQRVEGQRSGINEQISGLANSGGANAAPASQPAALGNSPDIEAIIKRNLGGAH